MTVLSRLSLRLLFVVMLMLISGFNGLVLANENIEDYLEFYEALTSNLDDNWVEFLQVGNANWPDQRQSGGNVAVSQQEGYFNLVSQVQSGAFCKVYAYQYGTNNLIKQTQEGLWNCAFAHQSGTGNQVYQTEIGFGNHAFSKQIGHNNLVVQYLVGNFLESKISQYGNNLLAIVYRFGY